jgi:hypothetical protein
MRQADRRLGLVDVLAAGAGRAQCIDAHVGFLHVDLDAVVDHRINLDRGKGSVATRIRVIGRDAHQAMHAVLGLEPAVSIVALDLHGRRLETRLFARRLLEPLDLVTVLLGPAHIHAQQHVGPVLALGAARAGMHFQICVVAIGFAGEQSLELAPRGFGLQSLERLFGFGDGRGVVLGLAELDHGELVFQLLLDAADGFELVFERGALLHDLLGARGIVPEARIFGGAVQFG